MRLVSAVLGFLLRKLGLVAAVVLSLFLGLLLVSTLVPALREAEAERDRLVQVAQERADLEAELDDLESTYAAAQSAAAESLQATVEAEIDAGAPAGLGPGVRGRGPRQGTSAAGWRAWPEQVSPIGPNPCAEAERALEAAEEALATFERTLDEAEADAAVLADPMLTNEQKLERLGEDGDLAPAAREIDNTESELAQATAEEKRLEDQRGSWSGRVVDLWAMSWRWLVWIALLLVLAPGLLRVVGYFVLMPLVTRAHTPDPPGGRFRGGDGETPHDGRRPDTDRPAARRRGTVRALGARTAGAGTDPQPAPLRLVGAVHQLRGRALRAEPGHR